MMQQVAIIFISPISSYATHQCGIPSSCPKAEYSL